MIYYWILRGVRERETGEDWMEGLSVCDRSAMLLLLLRLNLTRMANCLNVNDARMTERLRINLLRERVLCYCFCVDYIYLSRTAIYCERYDGEEREEWLMRRERVRVQLRRERERRRGSSSSSTRSRD